MTDFGWTPERVELLKKLHREGYSASGSAEIIGGGVTRNAVVGKWFRLGLSNARPKVEPPRNADAFYARQKAVKEKPPHLSSAVLALKPAPAPAPLEGVIREAVEEAPRDPRKPVPLLKLGACDCRWPLGDPMDPGFGFCGVRVEEVGKPYCRHHASIAYPPKVLTVSQIRRRGKPAPRLARAN